MLALFRIQVRLNYYALLARVTFPVDEEVEFRSIFFDKELHLISPSSDIIVSVIKIQPSSPSFALSGGALSREDI